MNPHTVMAIGAHIGDMDLAAGPLLTQTVADGGRAVLIALTPGERGHPKLPVDEYRHQKLDEGRAFAGAIGADFEVFDDISDGFLRPADDTASRIVEIIRRHRPDLVIAHWRHSIHSDHESASALADRARFLAGLPGWAPELGPRFGVPELMYAENWEDARGFSADTYWPISADAYETWRAAIEGQAFARGETYGFRYIDYYAAQLTMRGCLARTERAVATSRGADPTVTVVS